jgi:hypothetical protein
MWSGMWRVTHVHVGWLRWSWWTLYVERVVDVSDVVCPGFGWRAA